MSAGFVSAILRTIVTEQNERVTRNLAAVIELLGSAATFFTFTQHRGVIREI